MHTFFQFLKYSEEVVQWGRTGRRWTEFLKVILLGFSGMSELYVGIFSFHVLADGMGALWFFNCEMK